MGHKQQDGGRNQTLIYTIPCTEKKRFSFKCREDEKGDKFLRCLTINLFFMQFYSGNHNVKQRKTHLRSWNHTSCFILKILRFTLTCTVSSSLYIWLRFANDQGQTWFGCWSNRHNIQIHKEGNISLLSLWFYIRLHCISQWSPSTHGITTHVSLERIDPKLIKWIGTSNASTGLLCVMHLNEILSSAHDRQIVWKVSYALSNVCPSKWWETKTHDCCFISVNVLWFCVSALWGWSLNLERWGLRNSLNLLRN